LVIESVEEDEAGLPGAFEPVRLVEDGESGRGHRNHELGLVNAEGGEVLRGVLFGVVS
jgi:hypothetical protein